MTNLTIAGETFHVRIEGDETHPVLMLSHSLGATLHMWDAQMPALLKHFRVIRYDSRGHGGSVASPGPYSIARLGRDALAILDALEIDEVRWLGLSMGGTVGQWLLINAPARITRAVLANTAAQYGAADGWNSRIIAATNGGMDALADTILQRWFSDDFLESNDPHLEQIHRDILATPPKGYTACCAALRDVDLREGLRAIGRPVLVIAGENDPAATPAQTGYIGSVIAGAKLVTLKTKHLSNIEDPEGFTKAALDFLLAKSPIRRAPAAKTPPLPAQRRIGIRRLAARGQASETLARRPAPVSPAKPDKASAAKAGTSAPKKAAAGKTTPEKPAPKKKHAAAIAKSSTRKAVTAPNPIKTAAKAKTKTPAASITPKTAKRKVTLKAAPSAKAPAKAKPPAKATSKIRAAAKAPVKTAEKRAPRKPTRTAKRT